MSTALLAPSWRAEPLHRSHAVVSMPAERCPFHTHADEVLRAFGRSGGMARSDEVAA
jgi:hypothetical protein